MASIHALRSWTARLARRLLKLDRIAPRGALVVVALWAGSAAAQEVYTVTSTTDDGTGQTLHTLSWAIAQANANAVANPSDTNTININLPSGQSTISFSGPLMPIDANVTINGAGTPGLTVNGGGANAAFFVDTGTVKIENLTIANTNAVGGAGGIGGAGGGGGLGAGGALFVNNTANVTIQNVAFQNNSATGGAGGFASPNNHEGGGGGGGFHGAGGSSQPGGGGGGGFAGAGGAASDGGGGGGGGGGLFGNGGSNPGGVNGGAGGGGTNANQPGSSASGDNGAPGGGTSGGTGGTAGGASATSGTTGGGGGGAGGWGGGNAGAGGKFGGGGGAGWFGGNSGAGGEFGGGGGGGSGSGTGSGANGGFGGGGGAASDTTGATAGTGGFGAGNGGAAGAGFGVGAGGNGGSGLGGAIFVRTGGTLTIIDSGISGSSVTAGAGGSSSGTGTDGTAGSADGAALYAMANVTANIEVDSGTQTIADSIGGAGGLTKTGAGTLVLSGASDYTGDTEIAAGILSITGSTTSNTTIDSGGTLAGSGTITGNVVNNGTVNLTNSITTLTIAGGYDQTSGGTLDTLITSPGANSTSAVPGVNSSVLNLTLPGGTNAVLGGTYELHAAPGTYAAGTEFVFLATLGTAYTRVAGTINTASIDNVPTAQNLPIFYVPGFFQGNLDNLYFIFVPTGGFTVYTDFAALATTPNQLAVADYIDANSANPNSGMQNLINTLNSLSPAGVRNALDQMSGALYGSVAQTDLQSSTLELSFIARRLGSGLSNVNGAPGGLAVNSYGERISPTAAASAGSLASSDLGSGLTVRGQNSLNTFWPARRTSSRWNTWGFGYGLGGTGAGTSNAAGFNYSLGGTVVGLESLSENQAIGMYTGYVGSHLGSYLSGQSVGVNGGQIGTYLRRDDGINYFILLGGMGADGYNSRRLMQFGGINSTATANYGGWQSQAYLERGVTLQGSKMSIQPYAALQYLYVRQNSFTETGAGVMDLKVAGIDANSLRSLIGVRLAGNSWYVNERPITPVARALWLHEFLSTSTGLNAQFAPIGGNNFAVTGTSLGRDWAILGAGLNWNLGHGWQTYANYDAQVNVQQTFHVGSGGFQYSW
ncbi:MAG TPA: autotransporter domain-containing protein [Pirellulales bacterium]|jgi:uncharacterized protein with beta-barrel porin domain|nr:autotransporter domain-containing protein [Pirellulales bacterium]